MLLRILLTMAAVAIVVATTGVSAVWVAVKNSD